MNRNGQGDMEKINSGCYDMDSSVLRRNYTKRANNGYENGIVLSFTIHHAEEIDNPSTYPSVTNRNYAVFSWVEPGKEYQTDIVRGLPYPAWKQSFRIKLDRSMRCRFLNVEVLRYFSKSDPGTSTGRVVVGRARIPMPSKLPGKKAGRFGLVRPIEAGYRGEGHIIVSMELNKVRLRRFG